jgi:hypothetical protein
MSSSKKEPPLLIKQAGKAVEEDWKPTLQAIGDFLFGGGPSKKPAPAKPPSADRTMEAARKLEEKRPAIVVRPVQGRAPLRKEAVLDAEIVEEVRNSVFCETCGGDGTLGKPGHEIPCPVCSPRSSR